MRATRAVLGRTVSSQARLPEFASGEFFDTLKTLGNNLSRNKMLVSLKKHLVFCPDPDPVNSQMQDPVQNVPDPEARQKNQLNFLQLSSSLEE